MVNFNLSSVSSSNSNINIKRLITVTLESTSSTELSVGWVLKIHVNSISNVIKSETKQKYNNQQNDYQLYTSKSEYDDKVCHNNHVDYDSKSICDNVNHKENRYSLNNLKFIYVCRIEMIIT